MERKEYKLNDIFENQILNQLFEVSTDGLEGVYIRMYGEPNFIKQGREARKELEEIIYPKANSEEEKKKLFELLEKYESNMLGEMCLWEKQYYKIGVLDGIYFKKELKDNQKIYGKDKAQTEVNTDSFFYNYVDDFLKFIEYNRFNIWNKREDFKEIINRMSGLKKQYPNVRSFIEDRIATDLTKEEINAILEYMSLEDELHILENIEIFKLGIKENL